MSELWQSQATSVLPRSTEVVNALRVSVCPYPVANCDRECGTELREARPCEKEVGGVLDRELLVDMLDLNGRTGGVREQRSNSARLL